MLRLKAFNSAACGDDVAELEALVNVWLHSAHPVIHQMTQSPFGTHVVLSFLYEEQGEALDAVAEAEAEVPQVFEASLQATELDLEDLHLSPLPQAELPY